MPPGPPQKVAGQLIQGTGLGPAAKGHTQLPGQGRLAYSRGGIAKDGEHLGAEVSGVTEGVSPVCCPRQEPLPIHHQPSPTSVQLSTLQQHLC